MIEVIFTIGIIFIVGLAIGSFLNVVIYRSVHGDSPLRGRSYCDTCKKPIAWYDNIPLLSFVLLGSKCRHCKALIPWEYPAVELITGLLFVWWYMVGFTFFSLSAQPFAIIQPLFWLSVGILFVMILFADLSYMIIPDSAVLLLTVFSLLYRGMLVATNVMTGTDFGYSLLSAIGATLFFLTLVLVTKEKGMGYGDVKLAFPLGLILGFPGIVVGIYSAFISGALVASILLLLQKKKFRSQVPFGPFLLFGTIVTLVWGEHIVRWYMQYL